MTFSLVQQAETDPAAAAELAKKRTYTSEATKKSRQKMYEKPPLENEDLQVPTLLFHAKDDKLASYTDTEMVISRFPNCKFISFESGGHLLSGHVKEIKKAVSEFISK